jgi:hypothetical protein
MPERDRRERHGGADDCADHDGTAIQRDELLDREQAEQQQAQAEPGTYAEHLQSLGELSREERRIGGQCDAADAKEDRQPACLQRLLAHAIRSVDQRRVRHARAAAEIGRRAQEGDDGDQDSPDVGRPRKVLIGEIAHEGVAEGDGDVGDDGDDHQRLDGDDKPVHEHRTQARHHMATTVGRADAPSIIVTLRLTCCPIVQAACR